MNVDFQPRTNSAEKAWTELFEFLDTNRVQFSRTVATIAQADRPLDIVARLLSPGRSGARVVVVSYLDQAKIQHDWVLKLVRADSERLLEIELQSIEQHVRVLYPDLITRVSPSRAIAYSFLNVRNDFASWFAACLTPHDMPRMVDRVFDIMRPWYRHTEPQLRSFFELHDLPPEVTHEIQRLGLGEILDLWNRLAAKWPTSRGITTTLCHGDLNPTNILLQADNDLRLIDFANVGYQHWAADFARLERQLTFVDSGDVADGVAPAVDTDFYFRSRPQSDLRIERSLRAIRAIRDNAAVFFRNAASTTNGANEPSFEQEYFHMLAFQQLRLFGSTVWPRTDQLNRTLYESTRQVLNSLLAEEPRISSLATSVARWMAVNEYWFVLITTIRRDFPLRASARNPLRSNALSR